MQEAQRLQKLPPYLFARIEKKIEECKARGVDLISLGIGDPDKPTPSLVIEELYKHALDPENHKYPTSAGMIEFRKAVADWYKKRFGVELDPKDQIVTLIGSKEGIAHISFCYVDSGDVNLVPDPGYPVYGIGTILAGGEPYLMELSEDNGFLPDFDAVPEEIARRAKLMFLNYPNNPTGAVADIEFFKKAVDFAKEYDIIICHDAAYSEIYFEDKKPPSILEVDGAMDVAIEFNSLSKPYNMTGWRIGWAAGCSKVIESLTRLKSNLDSGVFQAIQLAGAAALKEAEETVEEMRQIYKERRDLVVDSLNKIGWSIKKPEATFYVWAPVPEGYTSESFAEYILEKAAVVLTPGNGYGKHGEGYFRIALTVEKDKLEEAMERIRKAL
ncbi:MAG TPA: LL-diaminopimelate aminotransferase [Peptococcaceae bacterium]|nr:MAG: LL-diaminopimelate aminotransferase [Clostridia bacterium 41_269]HBT20065.1 LL-diaminopimelate aminotransferase [Peptococcaceae bacterium]